MSGASAARLELAFRHARLTTAVESIQETIGAVTFVERGQKTDKYGWLSAFDELAEYLGRLS